MDLFNLALKVFDQIDTLPLSSLPFWGLEHFCFAERTFPFTACLHLSATVTTIKLLVFIPTTYM